MTRLKFIPLPNGESHMKFGPAVLEMFENGIALGQGQTIPCSQNFYISRTFCHGHLL